MHRYAKPCKEKDRDTERETERKDKEKERDREGETRQVSLVELFPSERRNFSYVLT